MSFQQNRDSNQEWHAWLREHHNRLLACGVPHEVVADERRWFVFIDHRYDQWSDWSIDSLSPEQGQNLFDFLIEQYGEGFDPVNESLVRMLDALECGFAGTSSRNDQQFQRETEM